MLPLQLALNKENNKREKKEGQHKKNEINPKALHIQVLTVSKPQLDAWLSASECLGVLPKRRGFKSCCVQNCYVLLEICSLFIQPCRYANRNQQSLFKFLSFFL